MRAESEVPDLTNQNLGYQQRLRAHSVAQFRLQTTNQHVQQLPRRTPFEIFMPFLGHAYHTEHDIIETKRKDEAGELRRFTNTMPCTKCVGINLLAIEERRKYVEEEEEGHTLLDLHQIACGPVGLA